MPGAIVENITGAKPGGVQNIAGGDMLYGLTTGSNARVCTGVVIPNWLTPAAGCTSTGLT